MYLKEIEIHGFKSFADKTRIEFKDGITAIVGPNGSGKSNIIDAIRWALGEQSTKSLRGDKMEDIIFIGSKNRKALARAEVSLLFDNSSSLIPIEYEEVSIKRRLFRSGESEYFINNHKCRLKDIRELFMDTGVGTDGYSIIGQGQIDAILTNKPEERRYIFEEASGITRYRVKKEESERKLKRTEENLTRIKDIVYELKKQYNKLQRDAKKAEKYSGLKSLEKNLKQEYLIREIKTNQKSIFLIKEEIKTKAESKKALDKDLLEIKEKIARLEKDYSQEKENLEKLREHIYTMEKEENNLENSISILAESEKHNKLNIGRLEKEISLGQEREKDFEEQISKLEKDISFFKSDYNKRIEKYKTEEQVLLKLSEKIKADKASLENLRNKSFEKYRMLKDRESQVLNLENRIKNIEEDSILKSKYIEDTSLSLEESYKEEKNLKLNLDQLNNKISMGENKLDNLKKEEKALELSLENISKDLDSKERLYNYTSSQLNSFVNMEKNYDGYYRSVRELMKRADGDDNLSRLILATVGDIIDVKEDYSLAIETALGGRLQNIITETEKDAEELVAYLKVNKLGRATFLPLNTIKGRNSSLKNLDLENLGVIGLGSEIIDYEPKYKNIVENLLANTIIVDSLNNANKLARRLGYKYKIVSLEGDIVNPGGSITGGSIASKGVNLLSRKNKIEKLETKSQSLELELDSLGKERSSKRQSLLNLAREIKEESFKLEKIKLDKYRLGKNLEEVEKLIEKYKRDLGLEEDSTSLIKKKKDRYLEEKLELELEIRNLEKEIVDLEEKIKKDEELIKANEEVKEDLSSALVNLKIELNNLERQIKFSQDNKKSLLLSLSSLKSDIEENKKDYIRLEEENREIEKEQDENKRKLVKVSKEIRDNKKRLVVLTNKIEDLYKKLSLKDNSLKDLIEKIGSINESISTLEMKKTKLNMYLENKILSLKENYDKKYFNKEILDYKDMDIESIVSKLEDLDRSIKKLGNINLDSIYEYRKAEERLKFYNEQIGDLEKSKADLNNIIEEMEEKMALKLGKTIDEINSNFNQVFKDLFGGGRAEIIVQDQKDILRTGIDIKAQPPGKKFQNLTLLSGGEKSLTAVALLFSIFALKTTPFCILDEIDASLDDSNIDRYINYLLNFSTKTQFIMITHRRNTMTVAESLYGVTMEEEGVSKTVSLDLKDIED